MKVLQHTRNKRNLFFKPDRADRNYRDRLLKLYKTMEANPGFKCPELSDSLDVNMDTNWLSFIIVYRESEGRRKNPEDN